MSNQCYDFLITRECYIQLSLSKHTDSVRVSYVIQQLKVNPTIGTELEIGHKTSYRQELPGLAFSFFT